MRRQDDRDGLAAHGVEALCRAVREAVVPANDHVMGVIAESSSQVESAEG
ncbi:hypothetical protein [Streptomyces sp. NBC_01294]|nr:hypothetical protein [Streptomyces sp. NBC_01294]WRZ55647.1 hypothetical protein OG534_03615 [Streptomyces sp. NBC_01294]